MNSSPTGPRTKARHAAEANGPAPSRAELLAELERTRTALRASEARYLRLAESLPQFIWEGGADGALEYVNQRWLDYSGLSIEQTQDPANVAATFHPDDGPAILAAWRDAVSASRPMQVEGRLRGRDGAYRWFLMRTHPVIEDGRVVRWFGTSTDITDVKHAEDRIRQLADDLRVRLQEQETLLGALPVGVFIAHDPECSVITTNPAGAAMLRLPPGGNVSKSAPTGERLPFRVYQSGVEVAPADLPMQLAARSGCSVMGVEVDVVFKDGEVVSLLEHATPLFDQHGRTRGCVGVFVDISDRKHAERALRESEERFQIVARTTNDAIWDWDLINHQVWWNEGVRTLFGYAPEQVSRDSNWWDDHIHPGDRARVLTNVYAVLEGRESSWRDEYRFVRADGSSAFVLDRGYVIRNAAGKAVRMVGAMHDLTERKRAEDALTESGRRKDEFLATLAHELRNPLAALAAAAQVLSRAPEKPAAAERARQALQRQVDHMSRLLDDLLDVSRITHGMAQLRKAPLEIMDAVHAAAETARPLIEARGHRFTIRRSPRELYVNADRIRLTQIIWNLLSNSAKYTDEGGSIELIADASDAEAILTVRDTGIGIAPEMLDQVFEMFSQATPALQRSEGGLGIGLSLVRGLVQLHGGAVEARSAGRGHGSEFIVRLPLIEAPAAPSSGVAEALGASAARRLRVLIADDNVDSAQSWQILLEMAGHDVRIAHDGVAALSLAGEFRPQLALLDIGMPGLNGYELAERIRLTDWGVNAMLVAVTGWGQVQDKRQARVAGFDHHFTKPVEMSALEPVIAEAANAASR